MAVGWGDSEYGLVSAASNHSAWVNAADWTENLEVLSNIIVGQQQQFATNTPPPDPMLNVHTATFIFTGMGGISVCSVHLPFTLS